VTKQRLSAVVEFGAAVGSSFSTATKAVQGDLSGISSAFQDIKAKQDKLHKFAGFDMKALGRAKREMVESRGEAQRLGEQLAQTANPNRKLRAEFERAQRKADKTAKAYGRQKGQLSILNHELKKAGVNTHDLEGEFDRLSEGVAKAERRMKAFQGVVRADVGGSFRNMAGHAARFTAVVGASVGAVGAAVTMTNKMTGEQTALAQSLNVSADGLAAWGGLAKEMGFEVDNVGDLMEELNNKIGESAGLEEITAVTESLQILGLTFEELQNLSPEEQFRRVAEAVKELDDHQAAVSAADILMGGEANKFFGYLRSRKEGVDELLAQQKQLNVLSDEGRAGAQKYNVAFAKFSTVIASTTQEISGLIGGALAPVIEEWGPKLADWVRENRSAFSEIGTTVKELVPAVVSFGSGLASVFRTVGTVISWTAGMLGGFDNLAIAVAVTLGAKTMLSVVQFGQSLWAAGAALQPIIAMALPGLVAGIKAVGIAFASNPIGLVLTGITLAVVRLITIWDDLKKSFAEGGFLGAVGRYFDFFGGDEAAKTPGPGGAAGGGGVSVPAMAGALSIPDLPSMSGGAQITQRVEGIHVYAAPGQSADEIADAVMRKLDERTRDARRGALYD